MKLLYRISVWSALLAVTVLLLFQPVYDANQQRQNAIQSRYDGFSGVLRLWICRSWSCGGRSLTSWLNGRIAAFEKQHSGVYIQLSEVDESVLRNFADGSVNPPDMMLFPPGTLETSEYLKRLALPANLRSGLEKIGVSDSETYVLPVAMGVYALACNRALLQTPPADWSTLDERPSQASFWLNWPKDSRNQCWSAALIALFSGLTDSAAPQSETLAGEGINLGLPTPVSSPTPSLPPADPIENRLPSLLTDSFLQLPSVYSEFTGGLIAAMPVMLAEISRLEQLSQSGKAPDWSISLPGAAFTDQIALLAVTACERPDLSARQQLCTEFATLLLSEPAQLALTAAQALSVIDTEPLYDASSPLSVLENALANQSLLVPPAFDNAWRSTASRLADQVAARALSPQHALEALLQRLA